MNIQTTPPIFDPELPVDTLIARYPVAAEVFSTLGMACVGCVFSRFHSVTDVSAIYHVESSYIFDQLRHRLDPSDRLDK